MKWAVFLGFLGLGCGYLLNDVLADRKSEEKEYQILALPIGVPYFDEYPREEQGLTVSEFVHLGSLVRMQNKESFPELIGALDGLREGGTRTDWPLKKLALIRWYQLDARSFLKWIRENPEVCPKGNFEVVICETVQEEYPANPSFAYEVIEKLVLELGEYPEGAEEGDWIYHVGRYSVDLPLRLEYLESLCGLLKHGDYQLSPSRRVSRSGNDNRMRLIQGILDRDDDGMHLAHTYWEEHDESLFKDLEEAMEKKEIERLSKENWRELKNQAEAGQFAERWAVDLAILNRWGSEDRDSAIRWFLQRTGSGVEARSIAAIIDSNVFRSRQWREGRMTLDWNTAIEFLKGCDEKGYPAAMGWDRVSQEAVRSHQLDPFAETQSMISQEALTERISEVARHFANIESGYFRIGGKEFKFYGLNDYARDYLERLEIADQVEVEIRRLNLIEVRELEKAIIEENGP